jgi:hypothetical protein
LVVSASINWGKRCPHFLATTKAGRGPMRWITWRAKRGRPDQSLRPAEVAHGLDELPPLVGVIAVDDVGGDEEVGRRREAEGAQRVRRAPHQAAHARRRAPAGVSTHILRQKLQDVVVTLSEGRPESPGD